MICAFILHSGSLLGLCDSHKLIAKWSQPDHVIISHFRCWRMCSGVGWLRSRIWCVQKHERFMDLQLSFRLWCKYNSILINDSFWVIQWVHEFEGWCFIKFVKSFLCCFGISWSCGVACSPPDFNSFARSLPVLGHLWGFRGKTKIEQIIWWVFQDLPIRVEV